MIIFRTIQIAVFFFALSINVGAQVKNTLSAKEAMSLKYSLQLDSIMEADSGLDELVLRYATEHSKVTIVALLHEDGSVKELRSGMNESFPDLENYLFQIIKDNKFTYLVEKSTYPFKQILFVLRMNNQESTWSVAVN